MTREEATNCLSGLLDAYNADWHGDYFYDNSDAVCDAVVFFMENRPRWISVEERLPEDDLPGDSERLVLKVLVAIRADSGRYTIRTETRERRKYYTAKRFGKWFWGKGYKGAITHWMPLPEPPTEEEV